MEYFKYKEFDSPDEPGSGLVYMNQKFLDKLDTARDEANITFTITSGYRTEEHNTKVGGKPNSSHIGGLAADIACEESRQRFLILKAVIKAGFHRIGIGKTFIHVDDDLQKDPMVCWLY